MKDDHVGTRSEASGLTARSIARNAGLQRLAAGLARTWRGRHWPTATRLSIAAATVFAYVASFVATYPTFGAGALSLSSLPALVSGWLFGVRIGLLAACGLLVLNVGLVSFFSDSAQSFVLRAGLTPGGLILLLLGVGSGWLGNVSTRVREQAAALAHQAAALRRSEAQMAAILEGAGVGIAVNDLEGSVLRSNGALARMLGRSPEELRGVRLESFSHPDDQARASSLYQDVAEGRRDGYQLERRYLHKDGHPIWGNLTVTGVRDEGGVPRFTIAIVEDVTERVLERTRREAPLHLARQFAAESDPNKVLNDLIGAARTVTGADWAGVFRFDEERGLLIQAGPAGLPCVALGQGAAGRAAAQRAPVVIDDYRDEADPLPELLQLGVRAMAAVPLQDEVRLLGALWVAACAPEKKFDQDDVETLQVLASVAASTLVTREHSRLAGVLLAARTVEHEINNRLTLTVGFAELVADHPLLPDELKPLADRALRGAVGAGEIVHRLRRLIRVEETDWGVHGTTIDLGRSTTTTTAAE